jgi:polar amino acid transport system substrate-binding protein
MVVLAACLFAGGAFAQNSAPKSTVLRVAVSPVFPPMVFKQAGELAGVEIELARAFGAKLGRKVTFVEVPWEDQIEALRDGKTDIIMSSMSITTPRRYVIDFSSPYMVIGQMTLVRREDMGQYVLGYPARLPGTVGVLKATTGAFLVQRDFSRSKLKEFTSETEAVKALKKKKIDLFIGDSTLVWHLAGMHAADGLAAVPVTLSEEPLGWGIRKGDSELLSAADEFIKTSLKDGSLNQILRRWTAVSP